MRCTWQLQMATLVSLETVDVGRCTQNKLRYFLEVMKLLMSLSSQPGASGASPSTPPTLLSLANLRGNTPLHWAALNGQLEAVKYLVEAGATVSVKNAVGHDAAFEAEQAGKDEVASWLLSANNERGDRDVEEKDEIETIEGATDEDQKLTSDDMELDRSTT